jgi:hypothetical protein
MGIFGFQLNGFFKQTTDLVHSYAWRRFRMKKMLRFRGKNDKHTFLLVVRRSGGYLVVVVEQALIDH